MKIDWIFITTSVFKIIFYFKKYIKNTYIYIYIFKNTLHYNTNLTYTFLATKFKYIASTACDLNFNLRNNEKESKEFFFGEKVKRSTK
jgi:hypothetical protein